MSHARHYQRARRAHARRRPHERAHACKRGHGACVAQACTSSSLGRLAGTLLESVCVFSCAANTVLLECAARRRYRMQADAMGHRIQASHVCRSVGTHAQPARQAPQLDVEEIACTPGSSSVKNARRARASSGGSPLLDLLRRSHRIKGHRMRASHVCRSVGTHAQPARQAPQLDVEEIACTPGSSSVKNARHARAWRPVDHHCCRTSAQVAPCQWQLVGWQGNPTRASAAAVGRARHQWRPPHLCRGWH